MEVCDLLPPSGPPWLRAVRPACPLSWDKSSSASVGGTTLVAAGGDDESHQPNGYAGLCLSRPIVVSPARLCGLTIRRGARVLSDPDVQYAEWAEPWSARPGRASRPRGPARFR